MTDKIYRLADERDVGKHVFFSNESLSDALKPHYSNVLLKEFRTLATKYPYRDGEDDDFRFAFIEVTPADFSDEKLIEYLSKDYNVFKRGATFPSWQDAIKDIDDSRFTTLDCKGDVRAGARIMYDRLYIMLNGCEHSVKDRVKRGSTYPVIKDAYEAGYEAADAATKKIIDELKIKCSDEISKHTEESKKIIADEIKQAYEAGKRDASEASKVTIEQLVNSVKKYCDSTGADIYKLFDIKLDAEPKWISVEEKLPEVGKKYLGLDKNNEAGIFETGKNDTLETILASGLVRFLNVEIPAEENPKYTCVQCRDELNPGAAKFCCEQCMEDYEWIPAEFPRDTGKPCRYKIMPSEEWTEGFFIYRTIDNLSTVTLEIGKELESGMPTCQVRRDSVEGK